MKLIFKSYRVNQTIDNRDENRRERRGTPSIFNLSRDEFKVRERKYPRPWIKRKWNHAAGYTGWVLRAIGTGVPGTEATISAALIAYSTFLMFPGIGCRSQRRTDIKEASRQLQPPRRNDSTRG